MPGVLLCCWAHQAHRGVPLAGVLVCSLAHQSLKGAPWVGSYSVVQCVRRLMGQPRYCSAANAVVWGEKRLWWLHPLHMTQQYRLASMAAWLSSTGISPNNLFPPQSPPSHPLHLSLHSQQQPSPWDCATTPKLQFPAAATSRRLASLSGVGMAAARTV